MVRKFPELRGWGPDVVPWLEPLKELCCQKPSAEWTLQHQSLLQCAAAGGMWAPADLVGKKCKENDGTVTEGDGLCRLCGVPCTRHHRQFGCIGRWW